MMTTFHKNFLPGKFVSFTKGAPDIVLGNCKYILIDGEVQDLDEKMRQNILNQNSNFSKSALRVLAFPIKNMMKYQMKFSKM